MHYIYQLSGAEVFDVPWLVFDCVDLRGDDVVCSDLAQQKKLDTKPDRIVFDVLFDGQSVPGWYHALVEAQLLPRVIVVVET